VRGLSLIAPVSDLAGVVAHGLAADDIAPLQASATSLRLIDET
jgi:hypothetical protein